LRLLIQAQRILIDSVSQQRKIACKNARKDVFGRHPEPSGLFEQQAICLFR